MSQAGASAGETAQRLHLMAVWREPTVFTEAEQGTRVADAAGGVRYEVWARAAPGAARRQLPPGRHH